VTDRLPDGRWREPVGRALDLLAPWRHLLADVTFIGGIDPVFAGVHAHAVMLDGRSYATTAHACYPHHIIGPATRRVPTIVLPIPPTSTVVVHELGHVLDWRLGGTLTPAPVTRYAATDRAEAAAEYVTAHVLLGYGDEDTYLLDDTRLRLDALATTTGQ
jgi:hypothetical protein